MRREGVRVEECEWRRGMSRKGVQTEKECEMRRVGKRRSASREGVQVEKE